MLLLFTIGQKGWPLVFDTTIIVVAASTDITATKVDKWTVFIISSYILCFFIEAVSSKLQ